MAPGDMHNVEVLFADAPSRRTSRGSCCLAPLLVGMLIFFFSHKLTPTLLVKFDVSGILVHELVLRVVPVAQPSSVQPEGSLETLSVTDLTFAPGAVFDRELVLRVAPGAQPPAVQSEVFQKNLCVPDLDNALMARSDVGILQDFPAGYDGVLILWNVSGVLMLAALLMAVFYWVRGSAPTPMPIMGAVCGWLNPLFFQPLALFAAKLGTLRWFLAYSGKRIISRGHTKSSGNGYANLKPKILLPACPIQVVLGFATAAAASAMDSEDSAFDALHAAAAFPSASVHLEALLVLGSIIVLSAMDRMERVSSCRPELTTPTDDVVSAAAAAATHDFGHGFLVGPLFWAWDFFLSAAASLAATADSACVEYLSTLVIDGLPLFTAAYSFDAHVETVGGAQVTLTGPTWLLQRETDRCLCLKPPSFLGITTLSQSIAPLSAATTQQAAALHFRFSLVFPSPVWGAFFRHQFLPSGVLKEREGGRKGEKEKVKLENLQIFVKTLSGRTMTCRVPGDLTVEGLRHIIEKKCPLSVEDWYLTFNGKILRSGALGLSGISNGSGVTMHGRLRGGMNSAVPGAWYCPNCQQGGCWPARKNCFRCGQPRPANDVVPLDALPRRRKKGHFREEQFLGRQPQSAQSTCPTARRQPQPPGPVNAPTVTPNAPVPPGEVVLPPLNAEAMLAWLQQLGLDPAVLEMVRDKLPPPKRPPPRKPEKVMLDLSIAKDRLNTAIKKLNVRMEDHMRQLQDIGHQLQAKREELTKVEAEYDEAVRALEADNARQNVPPPLEEPAPVVQEDQSDDFLPPLDEADDEDMTDYEHSKRHCDENRMNSSSACAAISSSDLIMAELPTFGSTELQNLICAAQQQLAEQQAQGQCG